MAGEVASGSSVSYPASAGAGTAIGSVISAIANSYENERAYARQVHLNKLKYHDYINYARQVGATPTAIAQGLTGAGAGNMPTTSTGGNPAPDIGQSFASGISAAANLRSAGAAETTAESNAEINRMRLIFEPGKYLADTEKSLAEAFKNHKEGFMYGSMKRHFDELVTDLQAVRPWKIAGLQQGLINDMARYDEIVQNTKTLKAQEKNYNASSYELYTRGDLNIANKEESFARQFNINLESVRLQFENTLRAVGIDPNKPFWDNTFKLASYDPKAFKERMDLFIQSLQLLDNRIQENLGEHYKRNAGLLYGAYTLDKYIQNRKTQIAMRNAQALKAVSSIISFLGGSSSLPGSAGVDWWLKD